MRKLRYLIPIAIGAILEIPLIGMAVEGIKVTFGLAGGHPIGLVILLMCVASYFLGSDIIKYYSKKLFKK